MDFEHLSKIEVRLAGDSPFANHQDILNRVLTFLHRGIELLSEHEPAARHCRDAFSHAKNDRRYRVLLDPVIRDAICEGLSWLKNREGDFPYNCRQILEAAPAFFDNACTVAPLEAAAEPSFRLCNGDSYSWVWTEERQDDVFGPRFRLLFEREIAHSVSSKLAILRSPDERLQASLVAGHRLLMRLLPTLARSALAHVQLVAIIDVADRRKWNSETRANLCQNVSTHAIPATIFVSPTPLRSPWHAAEALLHEAAHKKLSDLVLTRPVFRQGYSAETAKTIRAVWNSPLSWNTNDWSTDRALFAFHVYVHLGLFFRRVEITRNELRSEFGDLHGMDPSAAARASLDRARYLGDRLTQIAKEDLGADGLSLLRWLNEVLHELDPQPPRKDPSMDLWLDRYDRETTEVGKLIAAIDTCAADSGNDAVGDPYEEWSARRIAEHLVQSDLVAAYRIFSILGESEAPSFSFYDADRWSVAARSNATAEELADLFHALRRIISRTLRHIGNAEFQRVCHTRRTKTLRDVVEEMIEHPYRHVDALVRQLRRGRARGSSFADDSYTVE